MTAPGRRRGRPPAVSLEEILDTAERLGVADVTMRDVAEELGVSVQGLYHYVPNREALFRLVADRLLLQRFTLPDAEALTWSEWMRATATGARNLMQSHPGVSEQFMDANLMSPGLFRLIDQAIGVLVERYRLPRAFAMRTMMTLMLLTLASTSRTQRLARSDHSAALDNLMAALRDHGELPYLLHSIALVDDPDGAEQYHFMLDLVLAGAERRLPTWEEPPEPATSPGLRELLDRAVRATS